MTANKNKEVKLEFKITKIELLEKTFSVPVLDKDNLPDVQFDLAINLNIDKENKKISNILHVTIRLDNNTEALAGITVACIFDIINFEDIIISSGDSVTIPDSIIDTLNIISIGTTRGIMFNEFKGTWLHNSILPVIDPQSFKIAAAEKND